MKNDWRQVSEELGITKEQIKAYFQQEKLVKLAEKSSLDSKVVEQLIKDGYNPLDNI